MAISPQQIEQEKKEATARAFKRTVKMIEDYFDSMLVQDYRKILLDPKIDDGIQVDLRTMLRENKDLAVKLAQIYRAVGWKIEYKEDFKYVNFKEL